ncbi:MAG: TSUP family transporter, partial [Betaproteobacteria bacterium]
MPWPAEVLVAAPLIVLAAYVLFGISGFGSALVSIPLLAHFLPLTTVLPLMVMLDFSAAFTTAWRSRRSVDTGEARRVFPAMLAGIAAGVLLLRNLP